MGVGLVAGTKLSIAPPGPTAGTYVEIKDVATLGDISQAFEKVKVESIGDGDMYEIKGTRNFPAFEVTLNRNDSDPGQQAARAASGAARGVLYWFKIDEGDTPAPISASFTAAISSPGAITTATPHNLEVDDVIQFTTTGGGTLPTASPPLTPATNYFVKTVVSPTVVNISATKGGPVINFTGAAVAPVQFTTVPTGTISEWQGEMFGFGTAYGGPNVLKQIKTSVSIRPSTFTYTKAAGGI